MQNDILVKKQSFLSIRRKQTFIQLWNWIYII